MMSFFKAIPNEIFYIIIIVILWYSTRRFLHWMIRKYDEDMSSIKTMYIRYTLDFIVSTIAVIQILSLFEATSKVLSVILASSGLIVAVLGFAAQESLGNMINGFTIIAFKPFEVNDRITLKNSKITGVVKSITLRHTVLQTFNNSYITVPNSLINKDIIENYHLKDSQARGSVDIVVSYNTDLEYAVDILKRCIMTHPLSIKKDKPDDILIQVRNFNARGVEIRANIWTKTIDDNFKACSDLRMLIKKASDDTGKRLYAKYR